MNYLLLDSQSISFCLHHFSNLYQKGPEREEKGIKSNMYVF